MKNPVPTEGWDAERVAQLIKLFNDGLSASQVARQLGMKSRNAVIGKLHRLRLAGVVGASINAPHKPTASSARPKVWHVERDIKAKRVPPPKPIVYEKPASEFAVTILEARADQCRFIEGDYRVTDAAQALCCGAPTLDGKPYCGHHHALTSYVPANNPRSFNRMVMYFGAR